jgi:hypothetical protein
MARLDEHKLMALQAKNNHVRMFMNAELSDETFELFLNGETDGLVEDDWYPAWPRGELLVRCDDDECDSGDGTPQVWKPPRGASGRLLKTWFLCPNFCNLSQRLAGRFIREMKDGARPRDETLEARCRARLMASRKNVRRYTADYQAEVLAEDVDEVTWAAIVDENLETYRMNDRLDEVEAIAWQMGYTEDEALAYLAVDPDLLEAWRRRRTTTNPLDDEPAIETPYD